METSSVLASGRGLRASEGRQSSSTVSWISSPLVAFLILALLLRMYFLAAHTTVLENEGAGYAQQAENLLNGRTFEGIVPGVDVVETWLYPVLIAGMTALIRNSELATRLVSLIAGTCLVIPMYLIALRLYGRRTAWVAGSLTAIHPLLIGLSVAGYTEGLHLTLMMTAVYWSLVLIGQKSMRSVIFAGMFWGLAYLNRPESLLLMLLAALVVLGAAVLNGNNLKKPILRCAAMSCVFTAVAVPYIFFLYVHTGQIRLEGKNLLNYTIGMRELSGMTSQEASRGIDANLNEVGPLLDQNRFAAFCPYRRTLRDVFQYLLSMANRNKYWVYFEVLSSLALGSYALWFLGALGLFATPWDRFRFFQELFLTGTLGYLFFILLAVHVPHDRYAFPLLPILLLWFSRGVTHLADWGAASSASIVRSSWINPKTIGLVIPAMPVFVLLVSSALGVRDLDELRTGRRAYLPLKEAGLWLRSHQPAPQHIFSSAVVAYYGGSSQFLLPYASDSELALRYIRKKDPDFVVLEPSATHISKYIGDWLKNGIGDPQAELVYTGGNSTIGKICIYRWNHAGAEAHPSRPAQSSP